MSKKKIPYLDDIEAGVSPETSHPAFVAALPVLSWAEGEPASPFESDDGYDTLRTLEDHYRQEIGDEHAPGCIANLIVEWALVPEPIWESSQAEIEAWLGTDQYHVALLHSEIDAYIAGACGQFKIMGWIHPTLRFWAERAMMLLEHVVDGWEQREFGIETGEYAERLAGTRAIIEAAPEPPKKHQLAMYALD